jgi:hypothetical protein
LDVSAGTLLGGVNDAGVKRTGINVQAHGALVKFAGIKNTVDGLQRIDGARMRRIHLDGFGGLNGAFAGRDVLMNDVKIFDEQTADRDGHPAILVAMVVDGAGLANLPADGEQLIERRLVDQIASVVLAVPKEIGLDRLGVERGILEELADLFRMVEGGFGEFAELRDEIVNWNLLYHGGHGSSRGKYNAGLQRRLLGKSLPKGTEEAAGTANSIQTIR